MFARVDITQLHACYEFIHLALELGSVLQGQQIDVTIVGMIQMIDVGKAGMTEFR